MKNVIFSLNKTSIKLSKASLLLYPFWFSLWSYLDREQTWSNCSMKRPSPTSWSRPLKTWARPLNTNASKTSSSGSCQTWFLMLDWIWSRQLNLRDKTCMMSLKSLWILHLTRVISSNLIPSKPKQPSYLKHFATTSTAQSPLPAISASNHSTWLLAKRVKKRPWSSRTSQPT